MSYNSKKQSPGSSNCSEVSILGIIESLKTSFLDDDHNKAVREEASVREKCDILETELGELKVQKLILVDECDRWKREFEVNDDKLNDLARELSVMKEKEVRAIKRYDKLFEDLRKMEDEKRVMIENVADLSDIMEGLKSKLREKEGEIDELVREKDDQLEELEGLRRRNVYLEEEKAGFDTRLEGLRREKDEKIKELLKSDEAKRQVEAQCKAQWEEIESLRWMNASLEEQKAESQARVEELRNRNGEVDEIIKKVMEEVKSLGRKQKELVKVKDEEIQKLEKEKIELLAKLGQIEERFLKLEEDVITCMCLDVGRDKRFASSLIGRLLSGIVVALDTEEIGLTSNVGVVKDGNLHEAVNSWEFCETIYYEAECRS